jgi:hypothetical protein
MCAKPYVSAHKVLYATPDAITVAADTFAQSDTACEQIMLLSTAYNDSEALLLRSFASAGTSIIRLGYNLNHPSCQCWLLCAAML